MKVSCSVNQCRIYSYLGLVKPSTTFPPLQLYSILAARNHGLIYFRSFQLKRLFSSQPCKKIQSLSNLLLMIISERSSQVYKVVRFYCFDRNAWVLYSIFEFSANSQGSVFISSLFNSAGRPIGYYH